VAYGLGYGYVPARLCLLTALLLYFDYTPAYVYILMLYSIVMVVYLNYSEVYATFQPASILEKRKKNERPL